MSTVGGPEGHNYGNYASSCTTPASPAQSAARSPFNFSFRFRRLSKVQRDVLSSINQFQIKMKKAVVDVWWLFDDGGLTLLIPHLLSVHKTFLEGAKLRVFVTANNAASVMEEKKKLVVLLYILLQCYHNIVFTTFPFALPMAYSDSMQTFLHTTADFFFCE